MFLSKINSILFVSLLEQGYVTISFDYIKNMVCFNGFSGNFDKNNFFNGKKGLLYEMFFWKFKVFCGHICKKKNKFINSICLSLPKSVCNELW